MTRDVALCNPGKDLRSALKTVAQRQLRRLPVVDDSGALRGMLSLGDMALRTDDALSMGRAQRSTDNLRSSQSFGEPSAGVVSGLSRRLREETGSDPKC